MAVMMPAMAGAWLEIHPVRLKLMMPVESGLIIKGDARKILPLKVSQKNYIVVAVNDGELKLFEVQSDK